MNDFIELVAKMRELQKEYFRHRDPNILQASKKSELEVDAFIKMNSGIVDQNPNNKMFAEPQHPTLF
jgi:hypothetical protein